MHKRRQIDMTDLWVRTVRTDKPREEWRDAKQPNLELRVTEKGAKTWRLHYTRADGRRKATIDHGQDPAAVSRALREAPTFRSVLSLKNAATSMRGRHLSRVGCCNAKGRPSSVRRTG